MFVGLYLGSASRVLGIPGGWRGKRFEDKRVVLAGQAATTVNGTALPLSDGYKLMLAGYLVTGAGTVLRNVLVTKMVTNWFAGHRIVSAMGILISSRSLAGC